MVVVDSSVWIDFFNATPNPARDSLRRLLAEGEVEVIVPDLVLFEVLRGFRHERDHREALRLMEALSIEPTGGKALALAAAQHYRVLRSHGYTIRSPIDVLLASYCIENDCALLHSDRDFDVLESMRGLKVWRH